jgi:hypothetical protein
VVVSRRLFSKESMSGQGFDVAEELLCVQQVSSCLCFNLC